jgi:catechol 2,3-dioxygenase-like lactoylglutathione lyase family enzyme
MTELPAETAVTCACCGEARAPSDVASLMCHPEISICGGCVHSIAGDLAARPALTPIFPVHDMAAAREFWTRAGLELEEYSPEYVFVIFGGAEIAHLELRTDLDPERNMTGCFVHVADPVEWHRRWKEQGLPVTDVKMEPWGVTEFNVKDPSGNLVRIGRSGE